MARTRMSSGVWFLISWFLFVSSTLAFPDQIHKLAPAKTKTSSASATPTFNAKNQHVDVSGDHKWMAPGPNDVRGPCPGLNAMANHGYLPRSGFATIPQFELACRKVFRMGNDLASILAAYGAAFDGPGAGWSIAGNEHIGIGGSHNNYESDSSPMRADLHQYGSNTNLIISQFHELYDMQPDPTTANYDIEVIREFRLQRFKDSIAKNPYFYYAPFSGAVVSQAAFSFIYRFMANKSEEYPEGKLDKNVLKSFMSITGPEDKLYWKPGHERIPENWYTRNTNDPYNINYFSEDLSYIYKIDPMIGQPGCNTGKVNSFTPIQMQTKSGHKVKPSQLLHSPLCYGFEFALAQSNAVLDGLANLVLQEAFAPVLNALGCDTVPALNSTVGKACPGYSLYGGPKGKVAPGAIQN